MRPRCPQSWSASTTEPISAGFALNQLPQVECKASSFPRHVPIYHLRPSRACFLMVRIIYTSFTFIDSPVFPVPKTPFPPLLSPRFCVFLPFSSHPTLPCHPVLLRTVTCSYLLAHLLLSPHCHHLSGIFCKAASHRDSSGSCALPFFVCFVCF